MSSRETLTLDEAASAVMGSSREANASPLAPAMTADMTPFLQLTSAYQGKRTAEEDAAPTNAKRQRQTNPRAPGQRPLPALDADGFVME